MGCSNENASSGEKPADEDKEKQTVSPPQNVPLTFTAMGSVQTLTINYPLSEIHVKEKLDNDLLVFTKNAEDAEPIIGIVSDDSVTEIGTLFEDHYLNELFIEKVDVFGEDVTAIQALCGSSCAVTYLLSLHDETYECYSINGALQYIDLDKDGSKEVIAHTGSTISEIELYRKHNDQIEKASINEALADKEGVAFNAEKGTFEVAHQGKRLAYKFDSTDYSLHLATARQ